MKAILTELLNRPITGISGKHYIYTPRPIKSDMWEMDLGDGEVVLTLKEVPVE